MMVEKECGFVETPVFPSLWELRSGAGADTKFEDLKQGRKHRN